MSVTERKKSKHFFFFIAKMRSEYVPFFLTSRCLRYLAENIPIHTADRGQGLPITNSRRDVLSQIQECKAAKVKITIESLKERLPLITSGHDVQILTSSSVYIVFCSVYVVS